MQCALAALPPATPVFPDQEERGKSLRSRVRVSAVLRVRPCLWRGDIVP